MVEHAPKPFVGGVAVITAIAVIESHLHTRTRTRTCGELGGLNNETALDGQEALQLCTTGGTGRN